MQPTKAKESFTPLKINVQIIGVHRDEKGEIIGEYPIDPVTLYKPDFNTLGELLEAQWPAIEERFFRERLNGSS